MLQGPVQLRERRRPHTVAMEMGYEESVVRSPCLRSRLMSSRWNGSHTTGPWGCRDSLSSLL